MIPVRILWCCKSPIFARSVSNSWMKNDSRAIQLPVENHNKIKKVCKQFNFYAVYIYINFNLYSLRVSKYVFFHSLSNCAIDNDKPTLVKMLRSPCSRSTTSIPSNIYVFIRFIYTSKISRHT